MSVINRPFAGQMRPFRFEVGTVFDIEEACGTGIGAVYMRLGQHQYFAKDIKAVILQPLVAGGMDFAKAEALVLERMTHGLTAMHELALDLILAFFEGMPERDGAEGGDPDEPHDVGKILRSFVEAGVPPESVRRMAYHDFVRIMQAVSEKNGKGIKPPTEAEFDAMISEYESWSNT